MTREQYTELSNMGRKIRNIVITYILLMETDHAVFFISQVFEGLIMSCMKDMPQQEWLML